MHAPECSKGCDEGNQLLRRPGIARVTNEGFCVRVLGNCKHCARYEGLQAIVGKQSITEVGYIPSLWAR